MQICKKNFILNIGLDFSSILLSTHNLCEKGQGTCTEAVTLKKRGNQK